MANGKTHARGTAVVGTALTLGSLAAIVHVNPMCVGIAAGALLGHLVTPDLDLADQTTYCERRIYRYLGPVGYLWQWYWLPYAKRNPHRGRSHTWPRGTWDRFSYLLWLPVLVSLLMYPGCWLFWLCVFAGHSVQDWVHLALDGIPFRRRVR